jgi:hypothetical protein
MCIALGKILHWIFFPLSIMRVLLGCWWLTPVILATQEAEIRRIVVRRQPRQIVLQDPILKKSFTKKGW